MRKFFIASILILTFCAAIFAQTDKILPCPTISLISNPSHLVAEEYISYTVSLDEKSEQNNIKYIWTIKDGEIVDGQGTPTVKIKMTMDSLSVKAEVQGLPENCSNSVSESFVIDRIYPIEVDKFTISVARIDKARLDYLRMEMNNNPSAKAYIIEHFEKKTSRSAITRKNKAIAVYLKNQGIDKDRFVLLNALTGENSTEFFIVPAGATPPTCEDCITVGLKF